MYAVSLKCVQDSLNSGQPLQTRHRLGAGSQKSISNNTMICQLAADILDSTGLAQVSSCTVVGAHMLVVMV